MLPCGPIINIRVIQKDGRTSGEQPAEHDYRLLQDKYLQKTGAKNIFRLPKYFKTLVMPLMETDIIVQCVDVYDQGLIS